MIKLTLITAFVILMASAEAASLTGSSYRVFDIQNDGSSGDYIMFEDEKPNSVQPEPPGMPPGPFEYLTEMIRKLVSSNEVLAASNKELEEKLQKVQNDMTIKLSEVDERLKASKIPLTERYTTSTARSLVPSTTEKPKYPGQDFWADVCNVIKGIGMGIGKFFFDLFRL